MKYLLLLCVLLVMCTGCENLAKKTPALKEKFLITGAISKNSFGGDLTITDLKTDVIQFQDKQLGYGGSLAFKEFNIAGIGAISIMTLGPAVRYVFPVEQQEGILPYVGGSLGVVQTSSPGMDDSGAYLKGMGGVWFFLSDTLLIDLNIGLTMFSIKDMENDLSYSISLGILFGEPEKEEGPEPEPQPKPK